MQKSVEIIRKAATRINRKTGEAILGNVRVGAYCRVSSDSEEQLNSYVSQQNYYSKKIAENENWTLVDIYADEAISGTVDYKRSDFIRMINDALNGELDLIITKSISRFARNTLDTLKYVRLLKEKNVAILFEEENINTLEMSGELLLTILSSVAQQESETISSHVKLGLKMKLQRGEMIGFNGCYGYDYDKKTKMIYVNREEAPIIQYIFERYNEGLGVQMLCNELERMKVKTRSGVCKWHESTLRGILKNEKYVGDILSGKTFTCDPISHKRLINMGEEDQYYIKDHHEAIISRELWERTRKLMEERSAKSGKMKRAGSRYSSKYTFSNKIFCGFCGKTVTRRLRVTRTDMKKVIWQCTSYTKYGKKSCPHNKGIHEEAIEQCFISLYNKLTRNCEKIVDSFLKHVEESILGEEFDKELRELYEKLNSWEERKDRLIEMLIDKQITEEIYANKMADIDKKIAIVTEIIEEKELMKNDNNGIKKRISRLRILLDNKETLDRFDDEVFKMLINKIIIGERINDELIDPYMINFVFNSSDELTQEIIDDLTNTSESIPSKTNLEFISINVANRFFKFDIDEDDSREKKMCSNIKVKASIDV